VDLDLPIVFGAEITEFTAVVSVDGIGQGES